MANVLRLPINKITVPSERTGTLDLLRVITLAEDIMSNGQAKPIVLRAEGEMFMLVEGYHRLEAIRALGEEVIDAIVVKARLN